MRFEPVTDDRTVADWQRIHNEVVPTAVLTLEQVEERSGHHRLELAYVGDTPVGNSTVRRPTEDQGAVVIARVLAAYRRGGIGTALYARGLAVARAWADERPIETVVLASNEEGLAFALARGFAEVERYLLPGDSVPYVVLTSRPADCPHPLP